MSGESGVSGKLGGLVEFLYLGAVAARIFLLFRPPRFELFHLLRLHALPMVVKVVVVKVVVVKVVKVVVVLGQS